MYALFQGRPGHYLLLIATALLLFFNNLGGPTLWDVDEGRNATAALEMKLSGNYIVPTFNTQLRVDKPALMYWLQIACFDIFGVNEFAARFPSALAALATILCCYELGRALFRPSTGLFAGLILSSCALMMGAGHFANPDALLNFFVVAALTLFWRLRSRHTPCAVRQNHDNNGLNLEPERTPSRHTECAYYYVAIGLLLGLGTMAKGPVGVVLPVLVMIVFLAWEKRLPLLWNRGTLYAASVSGLVALPWYIGVSVETHGSFALGFFWTHNLNRFISPMDAHNGSPLYYVAVLLVGMAPWTVAMLVSLWYGGWSMVRVPHPSHAGWWKSAGEFAAGGDEKTLSAYRFLGAWLGCYLLFFGLAATKLPNYLLPVALPLALLTARFFDRWRLGELQPSRWVVITCLAGMAGVGIATGLSLACLSGKLFFSPLAGASLDSLAWLALFGLIPPVAALAGLWFMRQRRANGVVLSFFVGTLLFLGPLTAWALPAWNHIKAPQSLVEQIGALNRNRDIRLAGFKTGHLPSVNFYSQREVTQYETQDEALAFLHYQVPVYLFLSKKSWDQMKEKAPANCRLIAHHPDLYHLTEIVVVTNSSP